MTAYISSIGTAVPSTKIDQKATLEFMIRHIARSEEDKKKLTLLYRACGIQSRYSVIPDFGKEMADYLFFQKTERLKPFPTISARMALYERSALPLATQAIDNCLASLPVSQRKITHLITVSCTGFYAPGLDIQLIEYYRFDTSIERTCINFMGCYGVFNALKVASNTVIAQPGAIVLVVALELCSIHLQAENDEDALVSGALFGDGAAAVLVEGKQAGPQLELLNFYNDLALEANDQMSWKIGDFGFQMKLSQHVSTTIREGIGTLTHKLLATLNLTPGDIDFYAIHPGGKKILEAVEQALGLSKAENVWAYSVLRNYGNMSSPTVLFVLKLLWGSLSEKDQDKRLLSFAFGPGLTLEGLLLRVKGYA